MINRSSALLVKNISARLSAAEYARLAEIAERLDRPIAWLVRRYVIDGMERSKDSSDDQNR
jgi:predicted DNA-binding protein